MALHGNPFLGKLKVPVPDLKKQPIPLELKGEPSNYDFERQIDEEITKNKSLLSSGLNTESLVTVNVTPSIRSAIDPRSNDDIPSHPTPIDKEKPEKPQIRPREVPEKSQKTPREVPEKYQKKEATEPKAPEKYQISTRNYPDLDLPEHRDGIQLESPREAIEKSQKSTREPQENSQKTLRTENLFEPEVTENSQKTLRKDSDKVPDKVPEKCGQFTTLLSEDFNCLISLESIRTKQRDLLVYLFERAIEQGGKDNRTALRVSREQIACITNSSVEGGKDIARQLMKKSAMKVHSFVDGRGGWTNYILAKNFHAELHLLRANGTLKDFQSLRKVTDKVPDKVLEMTSNSSSSSIRSFEKETANTTETGPRTFDDLPIDWRSLDRTPLEAIGIPIHNNQLLGIYRAQQNASVVGEPLGAEDVQESINMIAHDVIHKALPKVGTPLSLLVGMLMKKNKYQVRSPNYVSPKTRAAEAFAKQMVQDRKRSEEAKEQIFETVFANWFDSLTGKEINTLTPNLNGLEAKKAVLYSKFRDQFYLTIRDNPSIDVTTLKLEGNDLTPSPANKEIPSTAFPDSNKYFFEKAMETAVRLNEEVRQLEAAVDREPKLHLKSELQKTLSLVKKKRQQIYDEYPAIEEEYRTIEAAIADAFPRSMNEVPFGDTHG